MASIVTLCSIGIELNVINDILLSMVSKEVLDMLKPKDEEKVLLRKQQDRKRLAVESALRVLPKFG